MQDVKYAPNGDLFVSVGSDFKIVLYNGDNGDKIADVVDSPHKGSIVRPARSHHRRGRSSTRCDVDGVLVVLG